MSLRLARVPQNRYALIGAVVGATAIQCTVCVVALLHAVELADRRLAAITAVGLFSALVSVWWVIVANLRSATPPAEPVFMWGPVILHVIHSLAAVAALGILVAKAFTGP